MQQRLQMLEDRLSIVENVTGMQKPTEGGVIITGH